MNAPPHRGQCHAVELSASSCPHRSHLYIQSTVYLPVPRMCAGTSVPAGHAEMRTRRYALIMVALHVTVETRLKSLMLSVSFTVAEELLALVSPSGSGKSIIM